LSINPKLSEDRMPLFKPDDQISNIANSKLTKNPWKTVISYAIFGFLWILFSDRLLMLLVQDPDIYADMQTYKGWFYVVLTASALFFLVKLDYRHILTLNQQLLKQSQTLKAAYDESIALEGKLKEKINNILDKQKFIDTVLDHSQVAIVLWDTEGVVIDANSYYLELLGRDKKELIGNRWLDFIMEESEKPKLEAMINDLKMGRIVNSIENKIFGKDGSFAHILWNNSIVHGVEESSTYIVSFGINITKEREHELKAISLAYEDSLTGLSNRIAFEKDIESYIKSKDDFALYYMDIDQFNALNDLHGHSYGDLFLKQLSEKLKVYCTDMKVYRWSGDDFILYKKYKSNANPINISMEEDVENLRHFIHKKWQLKEVSYTPTISISSVIFPQDGLLQDELFRNLDYALYEAKRQGRGSYVSFDPGLRLAMENRIHLETKMLSALSDDHFSLFYQPIYYLDSGKLEGAEVLIRWLNEPNVSVIEFINIAEESGIVLKLDEWVIRKAFEFLNSHQNSFGDLMLSINLSAQSIASTEFITILEELVSRFKIKTTQVQFEITEHSFLKDFEFANIQLNKLRDMGFSIALDDFGTQYSSLSYLAKLPFTHLKIDKSYIDRIATHEKERVIVAQVIQLAHSLGLSTVAEGIEYEDQRLIAAKMGCYFAQGYLFSKPLPEDMFLKLM
jgi:diguanylate cyclase (GGDEF)-like protein/PAS domain S-box-containing protein